MGIRFQADRVIKTEIDIGNTFEDVDNPGAGIGYIILESTTFPFMNDEDFEGSFVAIPVIFESQMNYTGGYFHSYISKSKIKCGIFDSNS